MPSLLISIRVVCSSNFLGSVGLNCSTAYRNPLSSSARSAALNGDSCATAAVTAQDRNKAEAKDTKRRMATSSSWSCVHQLGRKHEKKVQTARRSPGMEPGNGAVRCGRATEYVT